MHQCWRLPLLSRTVLNRSTYHELTTVVTLSQYSSETIITMITFCVLTMKVVLWCLLILLCFVVLLWIHIIWHFLRYYLYRYLCSSDGALLRSVTCNDILYGFKFLLKWRQYEILIWWQFCVSLFENMLTVLTYQCELVSLVLSMSSSLEVHLIVFNAAITIWWWHWSRFEELLF